MTTERFIGVNEVSQRTGLSTHTIYKLCEFGKLRCYKPFGKKLFFLWEEVFLTMKGGDSTKTRTIENSLPQ